MNRVLIFGVAALIAGAGACSDDGDETSVETADEAGSNAGDKGAAGRAGSGSGAAGSRPEADDDRSAGRGGSGVAGSRAEPDDDEDDEDESVSGGEADRGEAGASGAAGSDGSDEPQNIVQTAVAAGSFTKLADALEAAGLVDALSGAGPFTVFAPNDAAFEAFEQANPGVLAALSEDQLREVLQYHVIAAKVSAADLKNGQLAKTLLGPAIAVDLSGAAPKVGSASVTTADIQASNGVIHVIDTILLPPKDIIDTAIAAGSFSKLAEALTAAGLVDDLKAEGPFTVFAPTDAAFEALGEAPTGDALTNVLLYHVVSGLAGPLELKDKGVVMTLAGSPALVELTGGAKIAGATISATNVVAKNGVIHVIDRVITPPASDIVDTAVAAGGFTRLAAALTAAELVDQLKGAGPFTVFAPTDAAFEALGEAPTGDALRDVLLYHVVSGAVGAGDLAAGNVDSLLSGKQLTVDLASGVRIDEASVTTANILTKNGVIHVIDKVLVPE